MSGKFDKSTSRVQNVWSLPHLGTREPLYTGRGTHGELGVRPDRDLIAERTVSGQPLSYAYMTAGERPVECC